MRALPELLLDVQVAADNARRHHSLEDILVAAGMPRPQRVDREAILAQLVVRWKLKHPDDIEYASRTIDEILSLANPHTCRDRATTPPRLEPSSAPSHGNHVEVKPQSESGQNEALA
jgi:hypothetical protein